MLPENIGTKIVACFDVRLIYMKSSEIILRVLSVKGVFIHPSKLQL